jgi:hypothetical protein
VPDITPTLAVLDGRPVAAWSRYEAGGYRLELSRWSGSAGSPWSTPRPYGTAGSLFPRFATGANLLLYRDAAAGAWTILRLDESLRPTARASLESSADVEPVVIGVDAEGVDVVVEPGRPAVDVGWER